MFHPGHWYVNMRDALQTRESRQQLSRFVYDFCTENSLRPNCYLGVPQGAVPLGQSCNDLIDYREDSEIPGGILRGGSKAHGDPRNRHSVGPLDSGIHVVLVEDVTTTGGSSMSEILKLQSAGIYVDALVACVNRYERTDRGRPVRDVVERDYKVPYFALTDARTLLPRAIQLNNPVYQTLE